MNSPELGTFVPLFGEISSCSSHAAWRSTPARDPFCRGGRRSRASPEWPSAWDAASTPATRRSSIAKACRAWSMFRSWLTPRPTSPASWATRYHQEMDRGHSDPVAPDVSAHGVVQLGHAGERSERRVDLPAHETVEGRLVSQGLRGPPSVISSGRAGGVRRARTPIQIATISVGSLVEASL